MEEERYRGKNVKIAIVEAEIKENKRKKIEVLVVGTKKEETGFSNIIKERNGRT